MHFWKEPTLFKHCSPRTLRVHVSRLLCTQSCIKAGQLPQHAGFGCSDSCMLQTNSYLKPFLPLQHRWIHIYMQKRLNCTHSHNEATRYYLLQLCKEQRGKKVLAATVPVQASQSSEEFASLSPMMLSTVLQLSLADKRKKKTARNKMLLGGLSRVYTSLQSTLGLLVTVHIIHEGLPASTQLQLCKDYAKT